FVNSFSVDGSNAFTVPPYTLPGSSGGNVELLQTTAFGQPALTRITEAPLPAGWTPTNIMIHSLLSNTTTTQSGPTAILNCVQGDPLWVTFTDTFNGTSSTATTLVDAATGSPLPGDPPIGTTGASVRDTAVVTFSPAASPSTPTPTGTVTYEFFTTIDGTGPHTDQVVPLNADGTVP